MINQGNLPEWATVSARDLLRVFGHLMDELKHRKLVRSANNPVADYAEALAARALGLRLGSLSVKGFDGRDADGLRYEIKARRLTPANDSRQLSVIRRLDGDHFDLLVGILFASDFSVVRAAVVPREIVRLKSRYRQHVNGWILLLTDAIWEAPGVVDITDRLREASEGWL